MAQVQWGDVGLTGSTISAPFTIPTGGGGGGGALDQILQGQIQSELLKQSLQSQNWQTKQQIGLGKLQSQQQLQAALGTAGLQAGASKFGAEKGAQASMFGSQQSAEAAKYGANQQLAATQAEIAGQANRLNTLIGFKNSLLGQFMPLLNRGLDQTGAIGQGGVGTGGNFAPGGYPEQGVYTPQQIQGQINTQTAQNDARTAQQVRQAQQSAAGRGAGPQSPLLAQIQAQLQGQNAAANAAAAQNVNWTAGPANAEAIARTQALNSQNWQAVLQNQTARQNALLAAIAGIVGGAVSI